MSTKPRSIPIWGVVSATLTLGTLLSAVLATVTLDAFLEGPGPASVTTRVPGFVYANATVMKVCIVAGLVSSAIALARRVSAGRAENAPGAPDPSSQSVPVWGITSITLAPLTPLVGAVAVLTAQALAPTRASLSMIDMSQFSRYRGHRQPVLDLRRRHGGRDVTREARASSLASGAWPGHQRAPHRFVLALRVLRGWVRSRHVGAPLILILGLPTNPISISRR